MKIERHFMDVKPKNQLATSQEGANFEVVFNTTSREQTVEAGIERSDQQRSDQINERAENVTRDQEENTVGDTEEEKEPAYYGQVYDYSYQMPEYKVEKDYSEGLMYKVMATTEMAVEVEAVQVEAVEYATQEGIIYDNLESVAETSKAVEAVVAEALDITPEEATQLLEKAELPTDTSYQKAISEPFYQSKIVQVYYDASEPAELLTIADAPQVLAKLNQAVQQSYLDTQVEEVITEAPVIETEAVVQEVSTNTEENESQLNGEAEPDLDPTITSNTPSSTFVVPDVQLEAQELPSQLSQALDQSILEQVTSQIKFTNLGAGTSEIRMALTPENLGEVAMRVITQNGIITAQFIVASQRVREILESNFNQLKEEMKEKGIEVAELSVSVQEEDTAQQAFEREQQKSSARINQIINGIAEEFETEEPEILEQGSTISVTV